MWRITLAADLIVGATCLATAILLGRRASALTGRDRILPFGTALIFLTFAAHHVARAIQVLYDVFGIRPTVAAAARTEAGDWHTLMAAAVVGVASVLYLRLRNRYGPLVHGPSLYEDLDAGHRRAIGLHDTVVQSLTQAAWALDLGQDRLALDAIEQTLDQAGGLLPEEGSDG